MSEIDRLTEIERLATLELIDYEAARTEAAKRLGVRATILDREVAKYSMKTRNILNPAAICTPF